jgi:CRP/FNR family transcriptional regulator, cyclic AMP receptor protein
MPRGEVSFAQKIIVPYTLYPDPWGKDRCMELGASIAAVLGKTALFGSLAQADRLVVAEQMRRGTFAQGQTIFARGDPGAEVYLVVEGCVRLSVFSLDGRTLSFKHANPGDIFGEIACFDGEPRSADATALTPVEVMTLAQARFNSLVEDNPRVARAAITFLCHRLRETSEQFEAIALHPIEVRLARFFLARCKERESLSDGTSQTVFELGMSQTELALLVGASRQKVNAALALLEEMGAVKRTGNLIACNVAKLQRVAAG